MRLPPTLDTLKRALADRGVPHAYACRLLEELADHRDERIRQLISQGSSPDAAAAEADRRLGDPTTLADAAVIALSHASWIDRHPLLALVVLPAAALPAAWAGLLLVVAGINGMLSPSFRVGQLSDQARTLLSLACVACTHFVPAVASTAFCLFIRPRFIYRIWRFIPALVLAIPSSLIFVRVFTSDPAGDVGRLVVGLRALPDPLTLLLPLAAALLIELARVGYRSASPDTDQPCSA
jgi:hypothetical protein